MYRILASFLLLPLLTIGQVNPAYDPDFNGDGCNTVSDLIPFLGVFGACDDTPTPWTCGDTLVYGETSYATVAIGDRCWFKNNLATLVYTNGDSILTGLDDATWTATTEGAMAIYGDDESGYCSTGAPGINPCVQELSLQLYGRIYNGYAVLDERGLCPTGWHVPTDEDWMELETLAGVPTNELIDWDNRGEASGYWPFTSGAGSALKASVGWMGWDGPGNGHDALDLSLLPGGYRSGINGYFYNATYDGWWWSSSPLGVNVIYRYIGGSQTGIGRNYNDGNPGFSIRCIKSP